jgi:hypothetical protein
MKNLYYLKMEPVVGLEPTTDGLQNRCSTTELNWLLKMKNKRFHFVFQRKPLTANAFKY